MHYARREHRDLADVLACIRLKTTLEAAGTQLRPNGEYYLRSPEEMARWFSEHPRAVGNSLAIAQRCGFRLRKLENEFPEFAPPPGETLFSYLYKLVHEGVQRRYQPVTPAVSRQIAHELAVIEKLELAGYFLIVWDMVRFARERNILVQGRGSAANSAVCYALGITSVDPVGLKLLFERFLSEERDEPPDIDLDTPSGDQREALIQYIYQRYGREHAGMVAEVITYRARSAVRDIGKALGLSLDQVDALAKSLDTSSAAKVGDEARGNGVRSGAARADGSTPPRSLGSQPAWRAPALDGRRGRRCGRRAPFGAAGRSGGRGGRPALRAVPAHRRISAAPEPACRRHGHHALAAHRDRPARAGRHGGSHDPVLG